MVAPSGDSLKISRDGTTVARSHRECRLNVWWGRKLTPTATDALPTELDFIAPQKGLQIFHASREIFLGIPYRAEC